MSNIDDVNALLTAIHFDRFAEIEARHSPAATFHSFRGPILHDSIAIADWHRDFLRDYADCNYTELEYIESGDTVATRGTITAKGYDWRAFKQRVVEVFEMEAGLIGERRQYAMLADLELDKPATAAMTAAAGFKGGDAPTTADALKALSDTFATGEFDTLKDTLDPKATLIDSVYGLATGPDAMAGLLQALPRPAFGHWRTTASYAGAKDGLAELAIAPGRPRLASWVRMVEGKVMVIENYWMLREIGVPPRQRRQRHERPVILPI